MGWWVIEISQNGWEYTGFAYVEAKSVISAGRRTVIADGVKIVFDEEIEKPARCNEPEPEEE